METFKTRIVQKEKIYALSDFAQAAKLVKNNQYIKVTIGCAYKLIMETQGIEKIFPIYIKNISKYIEEAPWTDRVEITEPQTGQNFFIYRTNPKIDFEIVKKISIIYISLLSLCERNLQDSDIPGIHSIRIRGTEKFFDLELDTDKLRITGSTWVGIDFRN